MAYEPTVLGEIPEEVQKIESIGEAYHDFIGDRSNAAVRLAIQRYFQRTRGQSEKTTSDLIHRAFNGGDAVTKADLRLDTDPRIYEPADLATALFFGENDVRPLIFMINRGRLQRGEYNDLLNELQRRMRIKYNLRISSEEPLTLFVTNDAYKRDGRTGNPFNTIEEMAGSTVYDPGMISQADVTASQNGGHFHLDTDLVEGSSYWGKYIIHTEVLNGRYNGLDISLTLDGQKVQPVQDNITFDISYPKAMLRGPSVEVLAMIYKMITDIPGNLTDQQIRAIVGAVRIRNTEAGSYDQNFYTEIITRSNTLKAQNPEFILIFIFFLKELGDMLQHKVGIKYRHLALGTPDGLSSVAFLKRGGPISYIQKNENLLFRIAGTLHKTDGMTKEQIDRQVASLRQEAANREAAIAARKEAANQRAIAREAKRIADLERTRLLALASHKLSSDNRAALAVKRGRGRRNENYLELPTKKQRGRKQLGGSKWRKTLKKQKGGSQYALFKHVINALYMNLYYVIENSEADTCLFKYSEDTTILVRFDNGSPVFLNNKVLGLPLCSILYMLYEELYDLDSDTAKGLIIQFLEVFNFTDADIQRINNYIDSQNAQPFQGPVIQQVREEAQEEAQEEAPLERQMRDYDKDMLRGFVSRGYNIPGIIPYEYSVLRDNITESSFEEPITHEEINENTLNYEREVRQENEQGSPNLPVADDTMIEREAGFFNEEPTPAPEPVENVAPAAVVNAEAPMVNAAAPVVNAEAPMVNAGEAPAPGVVEHVDLPEEADEVIHVPVTDGYETNDYMEPRMKPQVEKQIPKLQAVKSVGTDLGAKRESRIQKSLTLRNKQRQVEIERIRRMGLATRKQKKQRKSRRNTTWKNKK